MGHPKRKVVFQPSFLKGYVSFREGRMEGIPPKIPPLHLTPDTHRDRDRRAHGGEETRKQNGHFFSPPN